MATVVIRKMHAIIKVSGECLQKDLPVQAASVGAILVSYKNDENICHNTEDLYYLSRMECNKNAFVGPVNQTFCFSALGLRSYIPSCP